MEIEFKALVVAGFPDVPLARINWGEHMRSAGAPYIVIHRITMTEGHTQQGPDGLKQARVQVDCYSPIFGEASLMGEQAKEVLDFYRGGVFRGIFFDTMRGPTRESGDNPGESMYRASLDFLTHWSNENAG